MSYNDCTTQQDLGKKTVIPCAIICTPIAASIKPIILVAIFSPVTPSVLPIDSAIKLNYSNTFTFSS